ncbi:precorrin-2 C(20)-methyltransferase [Lichenicoccus sp.]|uniref:precorrin-2 C(20)-methyltransferase n=1 Tax=Lichenicoccus sp. TaxID=2781899 RepID=UPI003D109B9E
MRGTLSIVGVGPGDPELLTIKAARIIGAARCVAFFAKRGRLGHARGIAAQWIDASAEQLRFEYPFTTELSVADPRYLADIGRFYERCAGLLAERLGAGIDAALLCEGDPFFYGSAMYLFDRLRGAFAHRIVPGVTGMSGCWSSADLPFTHGDDVLQVLPGTLERDALAARLRLGDAAVIMKVGGNLPKIRAALDEAGQLGRAIYIEHGTMSGERILPLASLDHSGPDAPYFSMILVPGRQGPR